jgi:hypothetical protein
MNYEYTAEDLEMYDDDFDNAEAPSTDDFNAPVPEGTYRCLIQKAEIRHNKYMNVPELNLTLVIDGYKEAGGNHSGRWLWNANNFGDKGMNYLKGTLAKLGYEGKLSELANSLDTLLDLWVEVGVKHKTKDNKTFVNTYINRIVDAPGVDDNGDEIPF